MRSFFSRLFGEFSFRWTPPAWTKDSNSPFAKAARWMEANPEKAWKNGLTVTGIVALVTVATLWLLNRPEPVPLHPPNLITYKITPPALAQDVEGKLVFQPVVVTFSQSAAPANMLPAPNTAGQTPAPTTPAPPAIPPVPEGVQLEPSVPGTWKWRSDTMLTFTPTEEWRPGTKFRVLMEPPQLLVPTVVLEKIVGEFTTPAFEVKVTQAAFYQSPQDPRIKQTVVSYDFTHAIEPAAFERKISLEVIGNSPLFAAPDRSKPFEVIYQDHNRLAHVRSKSITPPAKEDFVKVTLATGLNPAAGHAELKEPVESKIAVPDLHSYFRIQSAALDVRRTENGEPQPYLNVTTQGYAKPAEFLPNLKALLLPPFVKPALKAGETEEDLPTGWTVDTATPEVIAKAQPITLKLDAPPQGEEKREWFSSFDFTFDALPDDRQVLVTVAKETPAVGGYKLATDYKAITDVPQGPAEIHLLGRWGGILALTGDRKISVKSRNLPALQYRLGRVPAAQINHLVSQTSGRFGQQNFDNYEFDETNIARFAEEIQPMNRVNSYQANYASLDLNPYLTAADAYDAEPSRGLYFLRIQGWDTAKKEAIDAGGMNGERVFVLVTDLGFVVKANEEGTRDVFVQSIGTGAPVDAAEVQVLGKNGVPLVTSLTGPDGKATLNAFPENPENEKQPVAVVVRKGADLSFMPFGRHEHRVNFSRFEVGGLTAATPNELDGFLFTERGIYRPGDTIHAGAIVKPRDWAGKLEGLPIKVSVEDTRNTAILEKTIALPESGLVEFSCPTEYASPTGVYKLLAYLPAKEDEENDTLLASTEVRVEEFLPDTMKVTTRLTPAPETGWILPEKMQAAVDVQNLYGTPATDRRVKGWMTATPSRISFPQYPGYTFFDRTSDRNSNWEFQNWETGDAQTDAAGKASFEIDLAGIREATYTVRFQADAYEPDSGRMVKAYSNAVLVSPLPHAVGWKTEEPLNYIPAGTPRLVNLMAIDPKLARIDLPNLQYEVKETYYASILKEQQNGDYAYESVERHRIVETNTLGITQAAGFNLNLPVATPGEFTVTVFTTRPNVPAEEARVQLTRFHYSVVGVGNRSRSVEENAELFMKLSKTECAPGDEIQVSMTAPFKGQGLITIERDKVYTHQFFTTDTNSTVQTIRIPQDFEGTAYVNVTYLRALDSPEIFMSPLSYAVAPVQVRNPVRSLAVTLNPVAEARPGKELKIPYSADRPCKMVVFAVDEGILQVTQFPTPKPLDHFSRKRALLVDTSQILDLLMPEYSQIMNNRSAFGGGTDFQLNPFKRVTEAPVVYWSGIVDGGPEVRELTYNVPDYFNGNLRVMAVAVARDGMGHADRTTIVRSPVMVIPATATFAAPGDTFDVTLTVGNNLPESAGAQAAIALSVELSEHLETVTPLPQSITVARNAEQSLTFRLKARDVLGSASVKVRGASGNEEASRGATLSIRPATPYTTLVTSGFSQSVDLEVPVTRPLYPAYHSAEAAASALPLSLTRGLTEYLAKYPHGCTEQLTSGAFARLLVSDQADFGLSKKDVQTVIDRVVTGLRQRSDGAGGYGAWYSGKTPPVDFLSVYVAHFLTEAKQAGFAIPENLLSESLQYLQRMAAVTTLNPNSREYRTQAYGIYVLTRNDVVTTNYLLNLQDFLKGVKAAKPEPGKKPAEVADWRGDLTAVYLAASYQILKEESAARDLLRGYKAGQHKLSEQDDDYQRPLAQDAQYLAIVSRHFPEEARKLTGRDLNVLLDPIQKNQFNTLSAAYSVLALKSYSAFAASNPAKLTISQSVKNPQAVTPLETKGAQVLTAPVPLTADGVKFHYEKPTEGAAAPGYFYQVTEGGFDKQLPAEAIQEGLEVQREYLNALGAPLTEATMGDAVEVRLMVRSLKNGESIRNVAIVDLLPGGFEVVRETIPAGRSTIPNMDYNEVREDRVVIFGTATPAVQWISYKIRPTRRGEFVVPPVMADSMYDRAVRARGVPGRLTVK